MTGLWRERGVEAVCQSPQKMSDHPSSHVWHAFFVSRVLLRQNRSTLRCRWAGQDGLCKIPSLRFSKLAKGVTRSGGFSVFSTSQSLDVRHDAFDGIVLKEGFTFSGAIAVSCLKPIEKTHCRNVLPRVGSTNWCGWRGSNPRPLASEANTLSTELQPHRWRRRNCRGFHRGQ